MISPVRTLSPKPMACQKCSWRVAGEAVDLREHPRHAEPDPRAGPCWRQSGTRRLAASNYVLWQPLELCIPKPAAGSLAAPSPSRPRLKSRDAADVDTDESPKAKYGRPAGLRLREVRRKDMASPGQGPRNLLIRGQGVDMERV